jgi:hypothetical protein
MTSKEPQQYRLKPGIDLRITDLKDGLSFVHYQDDYVQWETEHVNAIFETIDEVATRKQIADIITFYRTLVNGWAETGAGADDLPETALKESVDRVFSLITGGMYE